jgi:hypothetical protein
MACADASDGEVSARTRTRRIDRPRTMTSSHTMRRAMVKGRRG